MKNKINRRSMLAILILLFPIIFFQNCVSQSGSSAENPVPGPLAVTSTTLLPDGSGIPSLVVNEFPKYMVIKTSFAVLAEGGLPPYSYRVINGGAQFVENVLTVGSVPGSVEVEVSDKNFEKRTFEVEVVGEIFTQLVESNQTKIYKSKDFGKTWTLEATQEYHYPGYYEYANFKGKIWRVGSAISGGDAAGIVQRSSNGVDWLSVGSLPAPRLRGSLLSTGSHLWYLGGRSKVEAYSGSQYIHKEVYRSEDGVSWETISLLPDRRAYLCSAILNDTLYAIDRDNTWVSASGQIWSSGPSIPLPIEANISYSLGRCLKMNNKIWFPVTRLNSLTYERDYSFFSFDGTDWNFAAENPHFATWIVGSILYAGKLNFLVEGTTTGFQSSRDGVSFSNEIQDGVPSSFPTNLIGSKVLYVFPVNEE